MCPEAGSTGRRADASVFPECGSEISLSAALWDLAHTYGSAKRNYKWPAILLAIFLAASALTPDSRRSMVTITSPLRIRRDEFPGAR